MNIFFHLSNFFKNEYFNQDMTKFYDCFKIPRGNFEFNRWTGRVGQAYLAKGEPKDNGKTYMEIKYLIADAPQEPPKAVAPAPAADGFSDDIPF